MSDPKDLPELDDEALEALAEAGVRLDPEGPSAPPAGRSARAADDDEPAGALDEVEVRDLLRAALRPPPGSVAPSLLGGVQAKLRARSRGKFYGDGWSTAAAPRSTYLVTSVIMLAVLVLVYALLVPWGTAP